MSGVRGGREDSEDGRDEKGESSRKATEREKEREGWTLKRERDGGTGEEWGISENRGTSQRCRVSCSDFSPHRSGFSSNPVLPKQSKQWVDNESDLCVIFIWSQ